MQNKPLFKCRCSSIGKIMSNPLSKSPSQKYADAVLSFETNKEKYANISNKETKTAKNLLDKIHTLDIQIRELEPFKNSVHLSKTAMYVVDAWIKDQLGYPEQNFSNKYTKKGLLMESPAIDFASKYYKWGDVKKNTERKENEYISGEWDVELSDIIVDIKCSWSRDTFPLMEIDLPVEGYAYQGQGYMELKDKPMFQLTYVLMDAPDIIVDQEAIRKRFELGLDEVDAELWDSVKEKHTYSHLPDELRLKSFFLPRNKSVMDDVYERVELCRTWIEQSGFYELYERVRSNDR